MKYQLFDPLTDEEYAELKADIAARGVMVPVEVDENGDVLDGHHRVKACEELGIAEYPIIVREGMTEAEKRHHVRKLNLARRHLTKEQRDAQILAMRQEGMSYPAIAEAVGVSVGTAHSVVRRGEVFNSENLPDTITGTDGKTYPATRRSGNGHHELAAYEREYSRPVYDDPDDTSWLDDDEYDAYEPAPEPTPGKLANLMTSNSYEWYTPPDIIERVRNVLGVIDLDPCSTPEANEVVGARHILTLEDDGLAHPWYGKVFMNPPYGAEIAEWVEKLQAEWEAGNVTHAIALLPARTDTQWFRVLREHPRCFLHGRLQFWGPDDKGNSATFPSVVVALSPRSIEDFIECFEGVGDVYYHHTTSNGFRQPERNDDNV